MSRYLLSRLDGAIAVSTAPLAHLRPGLAGVVPVVLPPVTDLSAFFAIEKAAGKHPTVLFLGRLEPRKGIAGAARRHLAPGLGRGGAAGRRAATRAS